MTRPVKVLEAVARYLPDLGGLETHVAEISSRLAARSDFDVTVATTDRHNEYAAFDLTGPVPVVRCRAWPASRDYYFAPGLHRVVSRGGWDLVHVQGVHTLAPIITMNAARAAGLPYIVSFHSGGALTNLRRRLDDVRWHAVGPLLRGASKLVAVSRYEQHRFAQLLGLPVDQIEVIANGGGLPDLAGAVSPVPGRIVSSGRLERYKGHHRVIEALPELLRSLPTAHLHILGAGPYESELRALAHRLGVADQVTIRLVPPDDRRAMAVALAESCAVAALSDYEAHPVAVMEALAVGVPVVGVDVAGIGDLVEDGFVTGVPPNAAADEVAEALLRTMLGGNRRRFVLPTWDEAADQLAALYQEVLGRRASQPGLTRAGR